MKKYLMLVPMILLLAACGGKKEKEEKSDKKKVEKKADKVNIKNELVGRWKNSNIKVTIKGESGDSILDANTKNWEELMKIKPIITAFNKNGTFKSVYKDLEGKEMMTREGTWDVKKDSLILTQDGKVNSFHVNIKGGSAFFKGTLDWDNDGQTDDIYWGKQQKLVKAKKEASDKGTKKKKTTK